MMPTARLLNDVGVRGMRIIRTTEAPRWEENAANSCLDLEEYYRSMLDFAVEYSKSGMMMEMEIWQYIGLLPRQQSYYLKPVKFANSERRGDGYCCNCNHTMVAVTSRRRDHASTTAAGNAVPWAFCVSCHTHRFFHTQSWRRDPRTRNVGRRATGGRMQVWPQGVKNKTARHGQRGKDDHGHKNASTSARPLDKDKCGGETVPVQRWTRYLRPPKTGFLLHPGNVVMAAQERVQRRIGETPRRTAPPAYRRTRWGVV